MTVLLCFRLPPTKSRRGKPPLALHHNNFTNDLQRKLDYLENKISHWDVALIPWFLRSVDTDLPDLWELLPNRPQSGNAQKFERNGTLCNARLPDVELILVRSEIGRSDAAQRWGILLAKEGINNAITHVQLALPSVDRICSARRRIYLYSSRDLPYKAGSLHALWFLLVFWRSLSVPAEMPDQRPGFLVSRSCQHFVSNSERHKALLHILMRT